MPLFLFDCGPKFLSLALDVALLPLNSHYLMSGSMANLLLLTKPWCLIPQLFLHRAVLTGTPCSSHAPE